MKIYPTTENNWRYSWTQFDPVGNLINLSTKTFNRDVFKLLNKNLNFVPMQKYFNKTKFFNEINVFYWRIKAHFKDQKNKPKTEEDILRKLTGKTWISPKNHHTIETFIDATNNKVIKKTAHIKPPKYSNHSKGEQEALEHLQETGKSKTKSLKIYLAEAFRIYSIISA